MKVYANGQKKFLKCPKPMNLRLLTSQFLPFVFCCCRGRGLAINQNSDGWFWVRTLGFARDIQELWAYPANG